MTNNKKHLLLIDILKIMTMVAIAILHTNEFIFYEDNFPLGTEAPFWYYICYYARFFSIGGQILVMIVYYLFGLSEKTRKSLAVISLFALLGQIILTIIFEVPEWDIYSYIAVSNLLIFGIPFFYKQNIWSLAFSMAMLLVPSTFYQGLAAGHLWAIVTGARTPETTGSWPLLPWFFLALLSYQSGLLMKKYFEKFKTFHKSEAVIWIIVALLSLKHLGYYYWTPVGPNYYYFNFTLDPWIFWSNIWPFVFILRLASVEKIQNSLNRFRLPHWISHLNWNRHLGGTYLISIIYLGIGTRFSSYFYSHPVAFDIFFLGLLPISEIISRIVIKKRAS